MCSLREASREPDDATAAAMRVEEVPDLARSVEAVLRVCAARADERIVVLIDTATAEVLVETFLSEIARLGPQADPAVITMRPRRPAFADLPTIVLDALLAADIVLDLTTEPWLYSDSFSRFGRECQESGTRLALVWGMIESLRTIAACPPSPRLTERVRRGLAVLECARVLHARSVFGADFTAELGDPEAFPRAFIGESPIAPGIIGAPLCASVTAPFVPGTATGRLAFVGAGRFQGPENRPLRSDRPVHLEIAAGRVSSVIGDHAAAIALADWFAAGSDDATVLMDCNIGFDPRAELSWADNTVVHSYAGGIMVGIGNPYQYHPSGSHRPGYHLDLMFPGIDVDLDDTPFIRGGRFVNESSGQTLTG